MSRGSYKRYEYDPTASVPKTTSYNKRKRQNYEEASAVQYVSTHGDACLMVSNISVSYCINTDIFYISICYELVTNVYLYLNLH